MSEIIENIYSFKTNEGKKSYIYSLKKLDDPLGYEYYLLTKDKENNSVIYETINVLSFLQNNRLNIAPVKKDTEEYENVLEEISTIMNKSKKIEVMNRK